MLKIKDNVDLEELDSKFNLEKETYNDDGGWYGSCTVHYDNKGIEIIEHSREIKGIDNSKLDTLYDLIQAGLVEKVKEE